MSLIDAIRHAWGVTTEDHARADEPHPAAAYQRARVRGLVEGLGLDDFPIPEAPPAEEWTPRSGACPGTQDARDIARASALDLLALADLTRAHSPWDAARNLWSAT